MIKMDIHKNIPLQIQMPQKFGEMQQHHNYYLHLDRNEMILAENAAEILAAWALKPGSRNIERLIERIAVENKTSAIFPCFTFPPHNIPIDLVAIARKEFQAIPVEDRQCICTIIALTLEDQGGHHCAAIYENGEVTIFDPMQGGNRSMYIESFKDIARAVFMTEDLHVENFDPAYNYRLQYTGGFMHIPPQHIASDGKDWYEHDHITQKMVKMTEHEKHELKFTSTESQNHFCYMWCIWYLHVKMAGLDLVDVVEKRMLGIDPLIVIKNYIWNIMTYTGFKRELSMERFFNENFRLVCLYKTNNQGRMRTEPCEIKFLPKNKLESINDCLTESWKNNAMRCSDIGRRPMHPDVKEHHDKHVKNKDWSVSYTKFKNRFG